MPNGYIFAFRDVRLTVCPLHGCALKSDGGQNCHVIDYPHTDRDPSSANPFHPGDDFASTGVVRGRRKQQRARQQSSQ